MYFSAPVVFMNVCSGGEVIRIASVSGIFSIRARPFSGPIMVTAVARASAAMAFSEMMVTLDRPWAPAVVVRLMM